MKRGQVTIFIILGIVIVGGVSLSILLLSGKLPSIGKSSSQNPESYLASCLRDNLTGGIRDLAIHGGSLNDSLNISFKLTDEKNPVEVDYLCYTYLDGPACIMQQSSIPEMFNKNLEDYSSDQVKSCFDALISNLKSQGYGVNANYHNFYIELGPGKLSLTINADVTVSKGESSSRYQNFTIQVPTQIYDTLLVAQDIANSESLRCGFSQYQLYAYPNFNINRYYISVQNPITNPIINLTGSEFDISPTENFGSRIYTIQNLESNENFRFAVRGCVMPQI